MSESKDMEFGPKGWGAGGDLPRDAPENLDLQYRHEETGELLAQITISSRSLADESIITALQSALVALKETVRCAAENDLPEYPPTPTSEEKGG